MNESHNKHSDIREQIREAIDHLQHILPSQAPIRDFVHHNTLHGFQHLPFQEALATARRTTGARGFLPLEKYRDYYNQGRISLEDLISCVEQERDLEPETRLADTARGSLSRGDIIVAVMSMPYQPVSGCQLNWQIEENRVLERLRPDLPKTSRNRLLSNAQESGLTTESAAVSDLWDACLQALHLEHESTHPEELLDLAPEQAETLLHDMLDVANSGGDSPNTTTQLMQQTATDRFDMLLERLGRDMTMRDLLLATTGHDLLDDLRPQLIRDLSSFLDQGVASWRPLSPSKGFYHYWCERVELDIDWQLRNIEGWQQHLELLQSDPLETIISELHRLGLARDQWTGYLERLALELPGWSGMVLWRHFHPGYESLSARIDMLDYLAVRLVLERIYAHNLCARLFNIESSIDMLRWYFHHQADEFTVREALFNSRLPEYLASRAQRAVHASADTDGDDHAARWQHLAQLIWTWRQSSGSYENNTQPTLCQGAWPLFQLMQQLGWCGDEVRCLTYEHIQAIFDTVDALDEDRMGFIWLRAYEKQYRDQILNALVKNRGRGAWPDRDERPAAQVIFCMDDREEGTRRHLEELYPEVETLGTAAHFSVPHNWRGLDDSCAGPQAPVIPTPVIPVHEVREKPAEHDLEASRLHQRRHQLLKKGQQMLLQNTRRGALLPGLLTAIAAPATLAVLIGKILAPRPFGRLLSYLRQGIEKQVTTRIEYSAPNDSPEATIESPRPGFTDTEQADRVQAMLKSMGLLNGFAPLVTIIGHGSRNQNNPHTSAYNCGACSGRFSGPNARLVAGMANRPEVRAILAERGIVIPQDTWFIGAEHDTCGEIIDWYDLDQIPDALQPSQQKLAKACEKACQLHAQERCRRLASAPRQPNPQQAFNHVLGRSLDFSQVRPELGHATNACAFIGRRSISRGAFFDRRAFLISYDASHDPSGEVLERHLLINGAVGAGINLEYYFSTVDNEHYGCGSKVTHNVTGFLGIMEGASSDLRTGLPRQMIEIHEAMRLLAVVETSTERLTEIYQRQPPLQELVGNGWVVLVAMDPDKGEFHLFDPESGWVAWQPDEKAITAVPRSADWYTGSTGPLRPALIKTPEELAVDA
ncbi:MAG: DUF2309 domain-containing protein [Candidatus Thiodiazotropha endolucinida]